MFGIDYSYDPPSITEMQSKGVKFVIRYVSTPGHVKNITAAEVKALQAAKIDIGIVMQLSNNQALRGASGGSADASSALAQVKAVGGPPDSVIRFSVDFDVLTREQSSKTQLAPKATNKEFTSALVDLYEGKPLTEVSLVARELQEARLGLRASQMPIVLDYLEATMNKVGLDRNGAYGEYDVIKAAFDAKLITYGWQTKSWSGGLWEPRAQLRQVQHNIAWSTGKVDYNESHAEDFGQWEGQDMTPAELQKELATFRTQMRADVATIMTSTLRAAFAAPWEAETVGAAQNKLQALLEGEDADTDTILTELRALAKSGVPNTLVLDDETVSVILAVLGQKLVGINKSSETS